MKLTAREAMADRVRVLRIVASVAGGFVMGVAALLAWLLAVDLRLGFEVAGSRMLECLVR